MENIKLFEIGAEGGSITIYRTENQNTMVYYYDENNSFADIVPTDIGQRSYSLTFEKELQKVISLYNNLLSLHPLFVHESCKDIIISFLKEYQLEKENNVDLIQWSEVLNVEVTEIKIEKPTYSMSEYLMLKEKYGNVSSWAIWNEKQHKDTSIIDDNIGLLNSRFVGVGLNVSNPVSNWSNFRGTHCRKLQQTFNKGRLKGFYLTDILKNIVEKNSSLIEKKIKQNDIDLNLHIQFFKQEMKDVKITDETCFIIFGNLSYELFNKHLKEFYPKNEIIKLKHYSARGTDKEWVLQALDKMGFLEEYLNNGLINEDKFIQDKESKIFKSKKQIIDSFQKISNSIIIDNYQNVLKELSILQNILVVQGGPISNGDLFEQILSVIETILQKFGIPFSSENQKMLWFESQPTDIDIKTKVENLHAKASKYLSSDVKSELQILRNATETKEDSMAILPELKIITHTYTIFVYSEILLLGKDNVENVLKDLKFVNNSSKILNALGQLEFDSIENNLKILNSLENKGIRYLAEFYNYYTN